MKNRFIFVKEMSNDALLKLRKMKASSKYFVKATICFGGEKITNATVELKGATAYIWGPIGEGQIYGFVKTKRTNTKLFDISGAECTHEVFAAHVKAYWDMIAAKKSAHDASAAIASMNADRRLAEVKEIIAAVLPEKIEGWKENAWKGNSHERRTRWENRAKRIGVVGYGGVVRDMFHAAIGESAEFFIDGKINIAAIGK